LVCGRALNTVLISTAKQVRERVTPDAESSMATIGKSTVELQTRSSGKPAGFALVTFEDIATATRAVSELHDKELEGRKMTVRFALPPREKGEKGSTEAAAEM
jgi:RNA recognition motif-containing protein